MEKPKLIKYIDAKLNNKRIEICLWKGAEYFFTVQTKSLVDVKTRKIFKTSNHYSVETLYSIYDMFSFFVNSAEINNKILLRDLDKRNHVNAKTNIDS